MKKHKISRPTLNDALTASLIFNIIAAALLLFCIVSLSELSLSVDHYEASNAELVELTDRLLDSNSTLNSRIDELEEALSTYTGDIVVNADSPPRYIDVPLDEDLQNYIWSLCCNYGISDNYEIVYAVMMKENGSFNPSSISSTNDYGLMQINISNHAWLSDRLGVTDFLDPYQNVHCGIYMIASLLHKYDTADALMVYNMGSRNASPLWQQGIHETSYTRAVLKYYKQFTDNI